MPKIYFAGASRQWREVREFKEWLLSQIDFEDALDWTEHFWQGTAELNLANPSQIAREDFDAIATSQAVIGYLAGAGTQTTGFWAELGYAIALGRVVVVLVEIPEPSKAACEWLREQVFLHHPHIKLFYNRDLFRSWVLSNLFQMVVPF